MQKESKNFVLETSKDFADSLFMLEFRVFFSHLLRQHQIYYNKMEKKTFAIVVGVKSFKHDLQKKNFIIETNHHAL